jgi:protein-S-isoprenylcysteine O-methyltransferase Ste14
MTHENRFRIALLVVFVLTFTIALYHRLQAARSGERISRRPEGILFAATLRTAGLLVWLMTLGYVINPAWVAWGQLRLPDWLRWLGFVGGVAGSLVIYWTLTSLGTNLTDTVVTRRNAYLVTHGPYRWIRHPFYVTTALLMAAVTLLTANMLIGLGCLLVLVMLVMRTPKEEQMLIERFGPAYRRYMETTGRYWPRWRQSRGSSP